MAHSTKKHLGAAAAPMAGYRKLHSEHPDLFTNHDAAFRIISDEDRIRAWQEKRRTELAAEQLPPSWADIGIILDDPYILMMRDLVAFPDGSVDGYLRFVNRSSLAGNAGVVILPVKDGEILLLHHFRHATRRWHLEFPRGFGESHLSPADSARREIEEEIGGDIEELQELGLMHSDTGMAGHSVHIYLARLRATGSPQTQEGIDAYRWLTVDALEECIRTGDITDAFTITAYARAKLANMLD